MSESVLDSLNKEQKQAVLYNSGPLLVLAGAGTGKTRVLTSKIAYIIYNQLAYPSQILAVTFTNKAANEMKERVSRLVYSDVSNLWIGTFHSIAAKILRRHSDLVGLSSDFTIIDPDDQKRLIKQVMLEFNLDIKEFPPKNFAHKINQWKDKGYLPLHVKNSFFDKRHYPRIKDIYSTYQDRLKKLNACDFGDLLLYNVEIFRNNPSILSIYLDKFRYILVDEYQDTNAVQHTWLKFISGSGVKSIINICCVGDDDQSIYGWRGAEIENILRFEKDYKGTKIVRLERNYRSTGNILDLASSLITNNNRRHKKVLWTERDNRGEKVEVHSFPDDRSETSSIAFKIKSLKGENRDYKDMAILIRAGYQTRIFEEVFMSMAIPYKIIGGLKFYERREIKDCIAYLRLVKNPNDVLAFERIVNVPKRGVGAVTVNKILQRMKETNMPVLDTVVFMCREGSIKGKARDALRKFADCVLKWNSLMDSEELTKFVKDALEEFGYIQYLKTEKNEEAKARCENVEEFVKSLEDFESLDEFLEYVSLVNENKQKNTSKDAVNIMTIHSAKGLEFDTVFLPAWEEGIFPSPKSVEKRDGLEEERRLAYVAITRTKKNLSISYAKRRYGFGEIHLATPSRFIAELPSGNILRKDMDLSGSDDAYNYVSNLQTNDSYLGKFRYRKYKAKKKYTPKINEKTLAKMVRHDVFGEGVIIARNGEKLTIAFKEVGLKTILKSFVEILKH